MSIGRGTLASATNATAIGEVAQATNIAATAVGSNARASGEGATAVGRSANVTRSLSTAVGYQAAAVHSVATAIGANATTTRDNQVMLGGAGSSIAIGDIDASTLAQVGPVDVVTIDAAGTLGRGAAASAAAVDRMSVAFQGMLLAHEADIAALQVQVDRLVEIDRRHESGIAAAMALGGMMIVPDSDVSLSGNVSTYRGETGFAAGLTARIAPKTYVSAGYAGSSEGGSNGGRVGVAIGF
ncbi:MAG: hypothetical protein HKO13_00040 [Sphingomonas sp.]|nr:hypothetical protein [Sphingomonas sp.]